MKNKLLLVSTVCLFSILSACSGKKSSSEPSSQTTSSEEVFSVESSLSSSLSSTLVSSETSFSSSSSIDEGPLSANVLVNLIVNAPNKDVNQAKTSETKLNINGYDGGKEFIQTQSSQETSYKNDLTIASGKVSQYYVNNPSVVYEDTYDEVRTIEDPYYIATKVYKNGVFVDETQSINLMNFPSDQITTAYTYYTQEVSCGVGSLAYDQFYETYTVASSSMTYSAKMVGEKVQFTVHAEYFTSEEQNQAATYDYTYLFDGLNTGFLLYYKAEQRIYRLSDYNLTNSFNGLTPLQESVSESNVTKGTLEEFTGEFPVDIHSSFVSQINITAPKTEIEVGETIALKTEVLPATAIDKSLRFESSNNGIATVDDDGRIKGISAGTCIIKAVNLASGVESSVEITVKNKAPIDAGDDSKKGDLQEALNEALYQVFDLALFTSTPPSMDKEGSINSTSLSTLSISDFAYDENTRTATYVGTDMERIARIFPYKDNGNDNLSNRYTMNGYTVFRNVIISFTINLSNTNTISNMILETRNDAADAPSSFSLANVTNENIDTVLEFSINHYGNIETKYESKGFVYPNE